MRHTAGRGCRAAVWAAALLLTAALAGCAAGGAAPESPALDVPPAASGDAGGSFAADGPAGGDAGGAAPESPALDVPPAASGTAGGGQPPAPGAGPESALPNAEALTAYRAVLLGQAGFLLAQGPGVPARPTMANDIPRIFSPNSEYARLERFAVLDLDGDSAQELVLQSMDVAGDMGGYVVLRMQQGEVYGFTSDWRSFWSLKADGSFEYSSPTGSEWGVCTVQFADGAMRRNTPLFCGRANDTFEEIAYMVNGQAAGEEDYAAAAEAQAAKPDAAWYPFDEEGIRQALSS